MRFIKKLTKMTVDMEKRLTAVEGDDNHRIDFQRDRITKLELRMAYLECNKHDYRFTGRVDTNKDIMSFMPSYFLPEYRYTFLCSQCGHTLYLKADALTQQQRVALRKLGLLDEVPGDRKAQK